MEAATDPTQAGGGLVAIARRAVAELRLPCVVVAGWGAAIRERAGDSEFVCSEAPHEWFAVLALSSSPHAD